MLNSSYSDQIQDQRLSPYNTNYFQNLNNDINQIQYQIKHITHFQQQRQHKFKKAMTQYKQYLQKQRKALERNSQHCKLRNKWYQQQFKKSWQIAISNRPLILRSLARTNTLKRDCDQWLAKIDDNILAGQLSQYPSQSRINYQNNSNINQQNMNNMGQSLGPQAQLKGSKLIDKYNQILNQYSHKI